MSGAVRTARRPWRRISRGLFYSWTATDVELELRIGGRRGRWFWQIAFLSKPTVALEEGEAATKAEAAKAAEAAAFKRAGLCPMCGARPPAVELFRSYAGVPDDAQSPEPELVCRPCHAEAVLCD